MIIISSNWQGIEDELERLHKIPSSLDVEKLDAALELAKEEVKASVHVLTGALKESTTKHSHHVEGIWEGEVTVGETTKRGYAKYELERKGVKKSTGTSHDFIQPNLEIMHAQFLAAVKDVVDG
jgi:hypothetical protein